MTTTLSKKLEDELVLTYGESWKEHPVGSISETIRHKIFDEIFGPIEPDLWKALDNSKKGN